MFERFSDSARRVVVSAQEQARMRNHASIGTEHLLLALTIVPGAAANELAAAGVHTEAAQAAVLAATGEGQTSPSGHMPFTPGAKQALERSRRESLMLDQRGITPEHLLLALLREPHGTVANVLQALDVDVVDLGERTVAAAQRAFHPGADGPMCPGCRRPLGARLSSGFLDVAGEQPVRLLAVWCTGCGVLVQSRLDTP